MANDNRLTKASDFPPEVLSLFDKYVHNVIDRGAFLDGAGKFAAGGFGRWIPRGAAPALRRGAAGRQDGFTNQG
jgi:hypothetical protein